MESTVAGSSRVSEAELTLQAERSVSPEETRESESELAGCRVRGESWRVRGDWTKSGRVKTETGIKQSENIIRVSGGRLPLKRFVIKFGVTVVTRPLTVCFKQVIDGGIFARTQLHQPLTLLLLSLLKSLLLFATTGSSPKNRNTGSYYLIHPSIIRPQSSALVSKLVIFISCYQLYSYGLFV